MSESWDGVYDGKSIARIDVDWAGPGDRSYVVIDVSGFWGGRRMTLGVYRTLAAAKKAWYREAGRGTVWRPVEGSGDGEIHGAGS